MGRIAFYQNLKLLYSHRSLYWSQVLCPCNGFVCLHLVWSSGFVHWWLLECKANCSTSCVKNEIYCHRVSKCSLCLNVCRHKEQQSLVESWAFSAASAFHKTLMAAHECGGMLNLNALDWVLGYVRGGPYPEQDVMPVQVWALLFGQIPSHLISIAYCIRHVWRSPSFVCTVGKNVVFKSFFPFIIFNRTNEISNSN